MSSLRKNVASQVLNFCLVNASTGAALTGATASGKVSGDGTQAAASGTFTELGSGQYKYVPTQAETNVTSFGLLVTATSAIPINIQCFTIGYDPTVANLPANAMQWLGGTIPAVNVTGVPLVDLKYTLGTISPATAGSVRADAVTAAVTAGTVSDKTGYALTAAYDLAKTASQAGDAMALTSGERTSVADALLGRNVSGGSSAGRTVKQALHFLRNKWSISAGTLTVYDTDDTTSSWTATVATDGTAQPIVSNDPA